MPGFSEYDNHFSDFNNTCKETPMEKIAKHRIRKDTETLRKLIVLATKNRTNIYLAKGHTKTIYKNLDATAITDGTTSLVVSNEALRRYMTDYSNFDAQKDCIGRLRIKDYVMSTYSSPLISIDEYVKRYTTVEKQNNMHNILIMYINDIVFDNYTNIKEVLKMWKD